MDFPKSFLWGAATASYQIEGAALEDGRGECIWTRFSHTPGKVINGDTGDVACDHYHRYAEDIELMTQIGLQAYRFSVAWSRVIPQGIGATNPKGLDFYNRLVDGLLAANIKPFLTLYHWDLPQALQDQGGWGNPDSVKWYADYADLMTRTLGDRVKNWITFNEPYVVSFVGNYEGRHAPGFQDDRLALRVAHHLMLSHAAGVPIIRQNSADAKVGITLDQTYYDPYSDSAEDQAAAVRADGWHNRWFLDPVFKGHYPPDMVAWYGDKLDGLDLNALDNPPLDFLGVNYYTRNIAQHDPNEPLLNCRWVVDPNVPRTEMKWEIYPEGLRKTLVNLTAEYNPKAIYITENGAAFDDPPAVDGVVEDPQRVIYLRDHLKAVSQAINEGVPMAGYFVWSLLDNFEWAYGYDKRFGIISVDYATQTRTLKQSAQFYATQIKEAAEA